MCARSANAVTIPPIRINGFTRAEWNIKNTANSTINTRFIKKDGDILRCGVSGGKMYTGQ